jgi:hypothetical protein
MPDPDPLAPLRQRLLQFAQARDWLQFHSPKNLSCALVVESPGAKRVTSWPRATSPSVSSEVIVWTEPDFGGGTLVAIGATCAILSGRISRATA